MTLVAQSIPKSFGLKEFLFEFAVSRRPIQPEGGMAFGELWTRTSTDFCR